MRSFPTFSTSISIMLVHTYFRRIQTHPIRSGILHTFDMSLSSINIVKELRHQYESTSISTFFPDLQIAIRPKLRTKSGHFCLTSYVRVTIACLRMQGKHPRYHYLFFSLLHKCQHLKLMGYQWRNHNRSRYQKNCDIFSDCKLRKITIS